MAATNKSGLLEITGKEFEKLQKLITPISTTQAAVKTDDVSIKDVIGHRAHWIELFLAWHSDGAKGLPVFFPAKGYKWNDLKRYNADLRAQQTNLDWEGAKAMLENNFDVLVAFIQNATNAELYGKPMKGANNSWTSGRWAEAAGSSHFRSATKFIRACLKASENSS
jgi:hypothetical protein